MSKEKKPTPPSSGRGGTPAASTTAQCPPNPCATPQKSSKGGNTTVQVDRDAKKIIIRSRMEYSGPDASEKYAKHAKTEIEKNWSGKTKVDGVEYKVQTIVDTKVSKDGKPTAGYDQIIVNKSTGRMTQTLHGAGPGNQTPDAMDPKRRRIAHEYGHTLGLPDEYHDDPNGAGAIPDDPNKKNNIMSETWESGGKMPHPHPDHYDSILKNYGCKS